MQSVRELKGKPSYSNTGVKNTREGELFHDRIGLTCSIDWLSFTFNAAFELENVVEQILGLPIESFEPMEKAGNGYTGRLFNGCLGINVLFNTERLDMGINVQIPGNAIRTYVELYGDSGLIRLMERVHAHRDQCHLTRLDLALDDFSDRFYTLDTLRNELESGSIVSYWKTSEVRFRHSISNPGEYLEKTIYFGSIQSDVSMRVYDKKLEQLHKGLDKEEVEALPSWVRWEMVFRHKYADAVLDQLVQFNFDFVNLFIRVLNYRFRIVDISQDTNRSRCPMKELWVKFIQNMEKLRLRFDQPQHSLRRTMNWLESQVMPSLAGIWQAGGLDGFRYIRNCADYFRSVGYIKDFSKEWRVRDQISSAADTFAVYFA